MLNKIRQLAIHAAGLVAILASFSLSADSAPKPRALSTINILADLVTTLAGDSLESDSLMGEGVDPHLYRATTRDLAKIRGADIVFAVGLRLEGRMQESLQQLQKQGRKVVFVGEALPEKQIIKGDPHVWFDPSLWVLAAPVVAQNLIEIAPKEEKAIRERLSTWTQQVQLIAEEGKVLFAQIAKAQRVLITSHDAFSYFGRFFEIEVHGIQGISTDAEASIKQMQDLKELIVKRKIRAIFVESSVAKLSIQRLQEVSKTQLGGVLYSDSLGPKASAAGTYLGMLRHNVRTVAEGLK